MRIVIVGGGSLGTTTAHVLIEAGFEVVVIERNAARITELETELDCGLIHGDGTKPAIQRETDPAHCGALICLAGSDQDNILASVVGRHVGFKRTVTKIEDPEFDSICIELDLGQTIVPDWATARALVDIVRGRSVPELTALGDDTRLFTFVADQDQAVADLALPARALLLGVSRAGAFLFVDELTDGRLLEADEAFVLTDEKNLDELGKRLRKNDH